MTVIYNMSIDRADKPWIGDRRFTEILAVRPGYRGARQLRYGTHARSHARWGGDTIPPTRPTLLDSDVKVQKYSQPG